MKSLQAGLSILALGGLVLSGPAPAAEDFYKDKTVNIIVGFTPGGGYDAYGRQLARFMGEHIPGKPTLIVQNMPGAASLVAAGHVYNVAPQDGTILAGLASTLPFAGTAGSAGVHAGQAGAHQRAARHGGRAVLP